MNEKLSFIGVTLHYVNCYLFVNVHSRELENIKFLVFIKQVKKSKKSYVILPSHKKNKQTNEH